MWKVAGHVVVSLPLFAPLLSILLRHRPLCGSRTSDWWRRRGSDVTAAAPIHQRTWALYSASHLRRGQFSLERKKKDIYRKKLALGFALLATFFAAAALASLFLWLFGLCGAGGLRRAVKICGGSCGLCSFISSVPLLEQSMGAQTSKAAGKEEAAVETPAEGAAVASKTNGQENGHAKTNGDASEEANKADVQANGSTPTEEAPKGEGEKVEGAEASGEKESSATNGETSAKADEGTPSTSEEGKQKKKRFSFKKPSFKLSGFSFKKTKKESEEAEDGAAAAEPAEGEKPASEDAEEAKAAEGSGEGAKETAAEEVKAEEVKAEGGAEGEEKAAATSPTEPETAASPEAAATE